jgi:hypothetical protein
MTMATDNSTTPALPEHVDVLNALLDIKGAVRLSRQTVGDNVDGNASIEAVDGVLTLAEAAIERLYLQLDGMRDTWPQVAAEVAHVAPRA